MKKESALQHKKILSRREHRKREQKSVFQGKKALGSFEKMATSTTVRKEWVNATKRTEEISTRNQTIKSSLKICTAKQRVITSADHSRNKSQNNDSLLKKGEIMKDLKT